MTSYVSRGRLCVFGIALTDIGLVPAACGVPLVGGEEYPEGSVELDALPEPARIAGERAVAAVLDKIEREKVRVAAEEVVERARLGDQNAVAHLVMARDDAKKGNPKAAYVHAVAIDYAKRNPFTPGEENAPPRALTTPQDRLLSAVIEAGNREPEDPIGYPILLAAILPCVDVSLATVAALSNGPLIHAGVVRAIGDAMGNEHKKQAFFAGVDGRIPPADTISRMPNQLKRALGAGKCVGTARRFQALRSESVPLSQVDSRIAQELG